MIAFHSPSFFFSLYHCRIESPIFDRNSFFSLSLSLSLSHTHTHTLQVLFHPHLDLLASSDGDTVDMWSLVSKTRIARVQMGIDSGGGTGVSVRAGSGTVGSNDSYLSLPSSGGASHGSHGHGSHGETHNRQVWKRRAPMVTAVTWLNDLGQPLLCTGRDDGAVLFFRECGLAHCMGSRDAWYPPSFRDNEMSSGLQGLPGETFGDVAGGADDAEGYWRTTSHTHTHTSTAMYGGPSSGGTAAPAPLELASAFMALPDISAGSAARRSNSHQGVGMKLRCRWLHLCLLVYLSTCLLVYLSICTSAHLHVCLHVCLVIC